MFKAVRLNATTYPVDPAEHDVLAKAGAELICVEGQQPEEIIAAAADCDALLVVSSRVPGKVIERLSKCRTLARLGAGTDRLDIESATRAGIVVSNVPDFCVGEQADHTMALLLSFARRLPYMTAAMRRGDFSARHHAGVHRIAGQTLGLIGFGSSAQAVAERAKGFGLALTACTRNPANHAEAAARLNVRFLELDDLLSRADFISLHLPLSPETKHLLGAGRLALLKPSAVIVNTARGALIDEVALTTLLKAGKIGGAALDVFENIDVFSLSGTPPQNELLALDNVIATPHSAGSSVESTLESKRRGAESAADVLLGRWPRHVVNPGVVPRFALNGS